MKKILLLAVLCLSVFTLQAQTKTTGVVNLLTGMTAQLELNNATATATLTFTGPSDRWYALQFGSFPTGGGMMDGQDVVYYNGTTLIDAVHNGQGIAPSTDAVNHWTVTSNTVAAGTRTIVATRAFNTGSADDYTFVYSDTTIDFAFSRGQTASFALAYHGPNRGYALNRALSCVAPGAPTASAQTFCSGATVANLAATGAAGATFSWYATPAGGTALAAGTALTTGNYYVSQTLDACESTRTTVGVTVTTVAAPTSSAQTLCEGATVANLTAAGAAGATFNWYSLPAGGTALAAGTALSTGNYYVSQTVAACESTRTTVAVTISDPANPAASSQTLCSGATVANLTATGAPGAAFNWYANPAGGSALAGTTVLSTGNYYVSQTVGTCESGRTTVAVTINTVAVPTASAQEFCSGAMVSNLAATGAAGAAFNWYSNPAGGTALSGTTLLASGNYYVSQTVGTCESARIQVAVTINTVAAPIAAAQALCDGAMVSDLTATGAAGATINWYSLPAGGTVLAGATLLASGNYYVSQTVGTCESTRTTVAVTVTTATEPTAADQAMCEGQTVGDLIATGAAGAAFNWYLSDIGGTALTDDTVLAAGNYYVSQSLGTCESGRTEITVTLNPVPDAPTGAATQEFTAGETIASLDVVAETGAAITWYMVVGGNLVEVQPTTALVDGMVYSVTQTINNCESDYFEITADEVLGNTSFIAKDIVVYPNPVKDIITVSYKEAIANVSVFNLLGQEVMGLKTNGDTVTVDTSKITAGTYIITITTVNGESASSRIIRN